jgi:hypothetical protein
MPSFAYFALLLLIAGACLIALRLALLQAGRRLQMRLGFSDTALTDLVIAIPSVGFLVGRSALVRSRRLRRGERSPVLIILKAAMT